MWLFVMRRHLTSCTWSVPVLLFQSLIGPLVQTGLEAAWRTVSLSAGRKRATQVDPLQLIRRVSVEVTPRRRTSDGEAYDSKWYNLADSLTSLHCVKNPSQSSKQSSCLLHRKVQIKAVAVAASREPGTQALIVYWLDLHSTLWFQTEVFVLTLKPSGRLPMNARLQSCPLKATSFGTFNPPVNLQKKKKTKKQNKDANCCCTFHNWCFKLHFERQSWTPLVGLPEKGCSSLGRIWKGEKKYSFCRVICHYLISVFPPWCKILFTHCSTKGIIEHIMDQVLQDAGCSAAVLRQF